MLRSIPLVTLLALGAARPAAAPAATKLRLETFVADSASFHVASTLIIGPTELVLFDAQNRMSDGRAVAERIAATGRHLKAIFISHPDEDHFFGALAVLERFPGTPIYMAPAGLREFARVGENMRVSIKQRVGAEAPDSLIHAVPIPAGGLTVDGEKLVVIADLQGDVLTPCNSAIWIPSMRAVLAGDIVFNGVHPYLAASSEASRRAWHTSIDSLVALKPEIVVAGHKKAATAADSPASLKFMNDYLNDFDAARASSADPQSLVATMRAKYPDLTVPFLLQYSARQAFAK